MQPAFAGDLAKGRARAAILWPGADWQALGLAAAILAPRARYVLAGVGRVFERRRRSRPASTRAPSSTRPPRSAPAPPSAPSSPSARGCGSAPGARIFSHVSIAEDAVIGGDALILSGVRIGARVRIGDRFIAQPGAVLGADGFSFVTPTPGLVEEARATGAVTAREAAGHTSASTRSGRW